MLVAVYVIATLTQVAMIGFLIEDQLKRRQDWRDNPLPTAFGCIAGLICFGTSIYVTGDALYRALT